MERLTNQDGDGFYACNDCNKPHCNECDEFIMQAQRLAAYEDTGLTPEEVKRVNTFEGSELEKMMVRNAMLAHELELAKRGICEMCRLRAQEQNMICGCVQCKYGPRKERVISGTEID